MAPVREVAFELECFEWADERLEVAGRWKGLGGHRLNRPVLTVDTEGGRRKRIVALPGGHLGAAGETWRASFAWPGDPGEITGAELEVGGNLVVDLPLPDKRRRRRRRSAGEQHTDDALRAESVALRGQVERLRAELAGREREIIALHAQLDEVTDEEDDEPEPSGADERTVEIQRLAGELERLRGEKLAGVEAMTVEIERLSAERDAARGDAEASVAAERARWQEDVDELRQAFADAAAEAEEAGTGTGPRSRRSRRSWTRSARRSRGSPRSWRRATRRPRAHVPRRRRPSRCRRRRTRPGSGHRADAAPGGARRRPGDRAGAAAGDRGGRARRARPAARRVAARRRRPARRVPEMTAAAPDEGGSSAFQALKERFEGLFASNGDGHGEDADDERRPRCRGRGARRPPRAPAPGPRWPRGAARARCGRPACSRRSSSPCCSSPSC